MLKFNLLSLVAGAFLSIALVGSVSASVIGPFPKENGEDNEIDAALAQLTAAGADITGVVALGKLETADAANAGLVEGLNVETEDYGLGLDAVLGDFVLAGNELKSFDMAADAVAGYDLFAVLIKAGQEHIIYFDGMFDDMSTTQLGNKGVSHISYFGVESAAIVPGVPVPASLPLLAGAAGLGLVIARRRKH